MKKLLFSFFIISNIVLAAEKPIIRCEGQGQKDNDITIELAGVDKDGKVSDILTDALGNVIYLKTGIDQELTWNTPVFNNEYNLFLSLETGIMKITKIKTGEQVGKTAKITCSNIDEALIYGSQG